MLLYLNGYSNRKQAPNENYARELYELFTLGEGNGYQSNDITETTRALTGYNKYSDGNGSSIILIQILLIMEIKQYLEKLEIGVIKM